jgi:hypothetical protein
MPLDPWLARWSANYAFLRRAVDSAGRAAQARLTTPLGTRPPFVFRKLPDGRAYLAK